MVEVFCEPLVPKDVWEAVQRVRRERGRRIKQARQKQRDASGKRLRPVAPGIVLKYPLTGLVRCGECGASMRPTSSGTKSAAGKRYVYYTCPSHASGSCLNGVYLPENWLRSKVIAALRRRLFPPPADGGQ